MSYTDPALTTLRLVRERLSALSCEHADLDGRIREAAGPLIDRRAEVFQQAMEAGEALRDAIFHAVEAGAGAGDFVSLGWEPAEAEAMHRRVSASVQMRRESEAAHARRASRGRKAGS